MKKLMILASKLLCWQLFAIDEERSICHYIHIDKNDIVDQQVLSIPQARIYWKQAIRNGFFQRNNNESIRGIITSHFYQRFKEFQRWQGGSLREPFTGKAEELDNSEHLKHLENALKSGDWYDYECWLHEQKENYSANFGYYSSSIVSLDELEDNSSMLNEGSDGDLDNYWNQEGLFESESDQSDEMDDYEYTVTEVVNEFDEDDCIQQNKSYQEWCIEQERNVEEMEDAIDKYYKSKNSVPDGLVTRTT